MPAAKDADRRKDGHGVAMGETGRISGLLLSPICRKEGRMTTNSFSITPLQQRMNENPLAQQAAAEELTPNKSVASLSRQLAIKRGLLASERPLKQREAHIARVRSQVEAGVYHISGAELAERLLENWTHFLDES
ncbi:MAG TPA: flagellar biosynthesis anti-sigma factor FlgM [Ktedonobacteraceae bacterium]|nr:flagellar biosynthesis anti-sigma factor FlgM [Ktedonobacteraceae bacterium]